MKKNRDFSAGPVWDESMNRYLVEIGYPDQTRKRKRFRSLKKAQTFWAREMTAIEEGTWNDHFVAKNVTLGQAFDEYREHCKVHNRSYRSYTEVALRSIEQHFGRDMPLARITATAVEKFKISRVAAVSQQTVDHSLAVFKAFFNWCDVHDIFHINPVRKVRMFHPNNQIVRYLTADVDRCNGRGERDRQRKAEPAFTSIRSLGSILWIVSNCLVFKTEFLALRR